MKDIEIQMRALDDFLTRARSQNAQHHASHTQSLENLSTTVKSSYSKIGSHFTMTYERVRDLGDEMSAKTTSLQDSLAPLDSVLKEPLTALRENIASTNFHEYTPTGETPQKVQYTYPTELPRTDAHENILAAMRNPVEFRSPSKSMPVIFNDDPVAPSTAMRQFTQSLSAPPSRIGEELVRPLTSGGPGLRELDVNVQPTVEEHVSLIPSVKKSLNAGIENVKMPALKTKKSIVALEGRENFNPGSSVVGANPLAQVQSTGRRRSPRNG